ncbi:MAG TPA: hypothetical protein DCQ36_13505 [Actinobacteria bacterium]|nr:hypothetical protein [Actinomycetota bacterium]
MSPTDSGVPNSAPVEPLHDATERELRRVVERLMSMPLARAAAAADDVRACAEVLVLEGRRLGVPVPASATVPVLDPQGFGPLIAVLGSDCLAAAGPRDDLQQVLDELVRLRRSLP